MPDRIDDPTLPDPAGDPCDWLKALGELLDEAGLTMTFSANCCSGLIGRKRCRCWRCRGVEPGDEDPGWAEVVQLMSRRSPR